MDRALPADVRSRRSRPDRPLPRLRRRLGGQAGRANAARGRWQRGPGAALFHAVEAELGDLPLIAEDLGVITAPVRRLRDELGLPACGSPSTRSSASRPARTGSRTTPSRASPTRVARQRHRDRLVALAHARAEAPDRSRPEGAELEPDPLHVLVARVSRDRARPGRPRSRQQRADEPAGDDERATGAGSSGKVSSQPSWPSGCGRRPRPPGVRAGTRS